MNKIICIYKITSPSGKVYIGQTVDYVGRLKRYQRLNCKTQKLLYNSFIKYSFKNHISEILVELPRDIEQKSLDDLEIGYIDIYKSCGFKMLNLTNGGQGTRGYVYTNEDRNKLSNSKKGKKLSKETKIKQSFYAKNRTNCHKKNLSKSISKKVLQYDLDGNFIKEWDSLLNATKNNFGDIRSCINKKQLKAGGYVWYYKENLPLCIKNDIKTRKELAYFNEKERRNKISTCMKNKNTWRSLSALRNAGKVDSQGYVII